MATVIDALLVSLNLDAAGFKTGTEDAVKASDNLKSEATRNFNAIRQGIEVLIGAQGKQGEAGERSGKQQVAALAHVAESYKRVRNEVLGLLGLFVAGRSLGGFTESITKGDDALGRLSRRLGVAVNDLGSVEQAAVRAGGTAEGAASTIEGLGSRMEAFKQGQGGVDNFIVPLARIGISPMDPHTGQMETVQQLLPQLADKFAQMDKTDRLQTNLYAGQLGIDPGMLGLLRQGRGVYEGEVARQKKWAPSEQDTQNARAVFKQVDDMQFRFTEFGRHILNDLSPTFTKLMGDFGNWLDQRLPQWQTSIDGFIKGMLGSINFDAVEAKIGKIWDGLAVVVDKLINFKPSPLLVRILEGMGFSGFGDAPGTITPDLSTANAQPGVGSRGAAGDMDGGAHVPLTSAQSNQKGEEALQYFMSQGDDAAHASGRVGNMMKESMGDPNAKNGESEGIFQWSKSRRDAIVAAFNNAHPGANKTWAGMGFNDQLWGAYWETKDGPERGNMAGFKGATDAGTAARNYSHDVIRPKNANGFEPIVRAHLAEEALDRHTHPGAHPDVALPKDYAGPRPVTAYPDRSFEQMQKDAADAQAGSDAVERRNAALREVVRQLGASTRAQPTAANDRGAFGSGAMMPNPVSFRGVAPAHLIPTAAMRWGNVTNNTSHQTHHAETHIGDIHLHGVKDGHRVARDMQAAIKDRARPFLTASLADTGVA